MSMPLLSRIADGLAVQVPPPVRALAASLAEEAGALAVLFYGSNLRTGSLEGVLDYYVLLPGEPEKGIWPRVTYHERVIDGIALRAKVATMTLAKFEEAASGVLLDTTIWTRFVQPSALIWHSSDAAAVRLIEALAAATVTAARLAVVLGPPRGLEEQYWTMLFEATYRAEFRMETVARAQAITERYREHFTGLLPLALDAAGIAYSREAVDGETDAIAPQLSLPQRRRILRWWRARQRMGKPVNLMRLLRATSTFDGAARYAAWKIERHTGVPIKITPWRERHPVLAAPGMLLSVWRTRRRS